MYIGDRSEDVVLVRKKDYDELVKLSNASKKTIEELAEEMWKEKGVASIKLALEIRRDKGMELVNCDHYTFDANTYIYNNERKFNIPEETKKRFCKLIKGWTCELMNHEFGERISDINKLKRDMFNALKIKRMFIGFTITGWLMAVFMFLFLIFK